MNNILADLLKAVEAIEEFYYSVPYTRVRDNDLEVIENNPKYYERRLVAQLKSEYDHLIRYGAEANYEDVRTDFEVIKKYIYSNDPDKLIEESFTILHRMDSEKAFNTITTIPDFFIHKEQGNKEREFQKLIVEVKCTPQLRREDFFLDLFKLNIYVEKYNFQNGVYLLINNDRNTISRLAKEYKDLHLYLAPNGIERIYLFVKGGYNSEVEVLKLSEI